MAEQIRTFIAIELGEQQRRALAHVQDLMKQERAGRYVRWVAPASVHLTLKFLGGVDSATLPAVKRAVGEACAGTVPFTLCLTGVGAFPNVRRPNVVWVGVGGDVDTVSGLAEKIELACAELGFEREHRAFSPHLTLGRVKRDIRPADQQFVGEMVAQVEPGDLGEFRVDRVSVMKSDLHPTGSVYTELYGVALAGSVE